MVAILRGVRISTNLLKKKKVRLKPSNLVEVVFSIFPLSVLHPETIIRISENEVFMSYITFVVRVRCMGLNGDSYPLNRQKIVL